MALIHALEQQKIYIPQRKTLLTSNDKSMCSGRTVALVLAGAAAREEGEGDGGGGAGSGAAAAVFMIEVAIPQQ